MAIRRRHASSAFLSMTLLALSLPLSTVLLTAAEGHAETRYVQPSAEVVVRTGQGNEYKIVSMVKDGASVELLKESDAYSLVRLANGREGWMLKRFLSVEPPLSDVVAALRAEKEELKQREMQAAQKYEEVSATLSRTKTDLDALVAERDKIRADFQTLQRDTADVVKIKTDLQQTAEENYQLMEKLTTLEQENSSLKKNKAINWFLAGAGVLIVGMFLGRMPSPTRKRKSSLLS